MRRSEACPSPSFGSRRGRNDSFRYNNARGKLPHVPFFVAILLAAGTTYMAPLTCSSAEISQVVQRQGVDAGMGGRLFESDY